MSKRQRLIIFYWGLLLLCLGCFKLIGLETPVGDGEVNKFNVYMLAVACLGSGFAWLGLTFYGIATWIEYGKFMGDAKQ